MTTGRVNQDGDEKKKRQSLRSTVSTELPNRSVTWISVLVFVDADFRFVVEFDLVSFDYEVDGETVEKKTWVWRLPGIGSALDLCLHRSRRSTTVLAVYSKRFGESGMWVKRRLQKEGRGRARYSRQRIDSFGKAESGTSMVTLPQLHDPVGIL